jgi:NAD(P)-dependent dehydrogenase (short-subunit alcohol dehydrogenase family)
VSLAGKVAVLTGAGAGIGRAAALELGAAGAALVLVDVDEDGLEQTAAAAAEAGAGEVRRRVADVADEASARGYVELALEELGGIDVLFNNAGIEGAVGEFAAYEAADFDRVIAVNLRGAFLAIRQALPAMIAGGGGSIVNTASMAGLLGLPGTVAYNAAKAGVVNMTKTAAAEGGPHGVRANAICPGLIETRMIRSLIGEFGPDDTDAQRRQMTAMIPLGRFGEAAEVARVVRFLADEDSSYVNGATITIDGGITATR